MKLSNLFPNLAILLMVSLIIGCSGGGTGGSTSTINSPPPSTTDKTRPSISLSNYALKSNETITVSVKITDSNGNRASKAPVKFESTPHMGTFGSGQVTGDATTDFFGNASITFNSANITGVGVITATALIDGAPVPQYATYYVNLPPLKLAPISIASSVIGGRSTSVSVNILDSFGNPYTGQDVDVFFNSESGAFNEYKVHSIGGVATTTYFAPNINTLPFTETITANLGDSKVTGYITINPNPNGVPVGGKLTLTTSTKTGWDATKFDGVVVEGNKATFIDSRGLPVINQPITFEVSLVDGYISPFTVTLNGIKLEDSAHPTTKIVMNTDSAGTVLLPTLYEGSNPSNYVVYFKATTTLGGVTYVSDSSQSVAATIGTTVTTPVVPGAPTNVTATPGATGVLNVSFTAPSSDGGSAITKYTVTAIPATGSVVGTDSNINTALTSHSITGLASGVNYTFTVTATNSVGPGPSSAPSPSVAAP
jgi:hypothetical protein